jgi:hypothetical protein
MALGLSASRAAFLSAMRFLVYGCPSAALRFLLGHAAVFVAFLNVFGFALLFICVARLIATWHEVLLKVSVDAIVGSRPGGHDWPH